MTVRLPKTRLLAAAIAMLSIPAVQATEGGGSNYPMGAENYLMGALPPPGVYPLIYAQRYQADELKDGAGNAVPVSFDLEANVIAPRLLWVTDQTLLGGQLFAAALLPLVDLDVSVNGMRQSNQGVGDLDMTLALAYHHSPQLHTAVGVDIFAPTGEYRRGDLANIGRNYWAMQGVYAASWVNPQGLNADIKLMYDYNFENDDTRYQSGQEFHFDYALGWGVGQHWTLGVGGYGYKQVTGDRRNGVEIGNKGQALAFGPSVKYDNGKGFFVSLKYQQEFAVENRPEGDALWIKTIIPF